jgi:hypothetical protein
LVDSKFKFAMENPSLLKNSNFNLLPTEIIEIIFSFIQDDMISFSETCSLVHETFWASPYSIIHRFNKELFKNSNQFSNSSRKKLLENMENVLRRHQHKLGLMTSKEMVLIKWKDWKNYKSDGDFPILEIKDIQLFEENLLNNFEFTNVDESIEYCRTEYSPTLEFKLNFRNKNHQIEYHEYKGGSSPNWSFFHQSDEILFGLESDGHFISYESIMKLKDYLNISQISLEKFILFLLMMIPDEGFELKSCFLFQKEFMSELEEIRKFK